MTEQEFEDSIVDALKASFPEMADQIEAPVKGAMQYFPSAWHWGRVAYDDFTNNDVLNKAVDPLDGEPVALIGEAYATSWSGWMEAAFRNAKRVLTTRFTSEPVLDGAINDRFDALFDIFRDPTSNYNVSDGSWLSNFAYTPPYYNESVRCVTPGTCLEDTEYWWPFFEGLNFTELTPNQVCSPSTYGLDSFENL